MDMQVAPAPLVESKALRLTLFLFLMSALFMATLDNQIVSTALPTIVGEFGQNSLVRFIQTVHIHPYATKRRNARLGAAGCGRPWLPWWCCWPSASPAGSG